MLEMIDASLPGLPVRAADCRALPGASPRSSGPTAPVAEIEHSLVFVATCPNPNCPGENDQSDVTNPGNARYKVHTSP